MNQKKITPKPSVARSNDPGAKSANRTVKSIPWQDDVLLVDASGDAIVQDGEPAVSTFADYLIAMTQNPTFAENQDPNVGFQLTDITAMLAVQGEIKAARDRNDRWLVLGTDHYARLKRACERPRGGYVPAIAAQTTAFPLAVVEQAIDGLPELGSGAAP